MENVKLVTEGRAEEFFNLSWTGEQGDGRDARVSGGKADARAPPQDGVELASAAKTAKSSRQQQQVFVTSHLRDRSFSGPISKTVGRRPERLSRECGGS